MNAVGAPEIIIIVVGLLTLVGWALPIAFAIWAFVTLQRLKTTQELMRVKLEAIEQLLRRG